ncbi:MAG TPA: AMP-binding protein [Holophaga sp.]|nr:AMP-binding protein [Holophaga sp.]
MDAHRALPESEAAADIGARLKSQLEHFKDHSGAFPAWRELAGAPPSEVLAAWSSLPVMTKADLRERFPVGAILPRCPGGVPNGTGGSTGEPTRFVHDPQMLLSCTSTMYYAWRSMGWRPGMPVRALWGAQRDIGMGLGWKGVLKQGIWDLLGGVRVNDGFALDPERGRAFLAQIAACPRPCAVYGYTSLLAAVARQALEEGIRIPAGRVATAWNGGETLFPEQSERFREAFGVPIQNYYGGREVGGMAFQRQGEVDLQVLRPFIFLEVVDAEGRACPPGEPGRLLVTSTVNRGSPFLRYEIGDLASHPAGASGPSGIRRLEGIQGRVSSTLRLKGRSVSSIYWNHLFKDYPEVRAFQVRGRGDSLRILLEAPGLPEAALGRIRATIAGFLGELPVDIGLVDAIPLSATGKLIHVIQEEG